MPESWVLLLTGITPDQIKDGLNRIPTRKSDWPPNAKEFRELCLPKKISPDGTNVEAYLPYMPIKKLTDQTAIEKRKKAGQTELEKMKALW
jgi:hypothetical protein